MRKVLIVNYTTPIENTTEIPYLWLTLKSYFQRNSVKPSEWEWLDPIYSSFADDEQQLINQIIEQQPDVLGISCYMWNDRLTLYVAEQVKKALPSTQIIAGGPALYYEHDMSWFVKHWYIDAVCEYAGYGEIFITDFLDGKPLKDIPFAVYPSLRRAFWNKSSVEYNRREFNYPMPYLDNIDYLKRFNKSNVKIILDSARGCPYACSFCEWGGGTSTKVVFKPLEETYKELELCFELLQPEYIDVINANFGVIKDDIEVAKKIVELHKQYKSVKAVNLYGPTKSNKQNLKQIYELFAEHKINDAIKISIQHTDETILKNIKRKDTPFHQQYELYKHFPEKFGTPLRYETMIGLPGETIDTFYSLINDISMVDNLSPLMHEWMMLPSAPAASPDYVNEMKLKTKLVRYNKFSFSRHVISKDEYSIDTDQTGERELLLDHKWLQPYEIVVSTYSYNEEDWAQMLLFKYYFTFLNYTGLFNPLKNYLIKQNINIGDFYKKFFNNFLMSFLVFKTCYQDIITNLKSNEPIDLMYIQTSPRLPYFSHYALIKFVVLLEYEAFFNGMGKWLFNEYGDSELIKICNHLKDNIKTPMKGDGDINEKIRQTITMCKYWDKNLFVDDFVSKY